MPGFTAINASAASKAPTANMANARTSDDEPAPNEGAKTVVSEYLGRLTCVSSAPAVAKSARSTAKTRKRMARSGTPTQAKRRRVGSVKDRLPVTKASVSEDTLAPGHGNANSTADKDHQRQASESFKNTQAARASQAVSTSIDSSALHVPKPISAYGSTTSMDALGSTSARTSCDFAKANDGRSFIVYKRPASPSSTANASNWISSPSPRSANNTTAQILSLRTCGRQPTSAERERQPVADTRGLQQGRAEDWDSIALPSTDTDGPTQPHANAAQFKYEHSANKHRRGTELERTTLHNDIRSAEGDSEDRLEDLSDTDLLDAAEAVEQFVENRAELTTPPPTRSRKQNMRDVDEGEDYGGALLSEAELNLLGKPLGLLTRT